ncbi:LTA synthase family protein [Desulfoluna spongiiphila]|uniref:Phosphoglycerol transferase MdoB n=1 Tax=Desulfoluna spongiiphila TaxID=419481 RepID=A0A1G5AE93_9BACT|nr:LTA synthase family protein [Desulfoluna spongiiphila]SCX76197.1 Phosphoglycerol transferase MdoB [Desulfoluna spongiiphila]
MTDYPCVPNQSQRHDSGLFRRFREGFRSLFIDRFSLLGLFVGVYLGVNAITRTLLMILSASQVDFGLTQVGAIYGVGLFFDGITAFYFIIPVVLYFILVPDRVFRHRFHLPVVHLFFFVGVYVLCYGVVAEWLFWDEFGKRFNFIAVDYLVYTTEVIGNIMESYPVYPLLAGLLVPSSLIYFFCARSRVFRDALTAPCHLKHRAATGFMCLMIPVVCFLGVDSSRVRVSDNAFNNELAKNGLYELFAAFRNNDLDYATFYDGRDTTAMLTRLREMVATDNSEFISESPEDITRRVVNPGDEKRLNIMLVTIESMSAEYMGIFGNGSGLTPNLDRLAQGGLFFDNFYATGTRSVRGLEALTLSTVPTAGRSIVKRPGNEGMFSLGYLFKERGYDTKWVYGGYGYFDNMNYYYGNNGFSVVDRTDMSAGEKTFANIWGVCDGDLFNRSLKEADASWAAGKPFMNFVFTTSNHRPYTYPEGKIDIPVKTGRAGGVKYTDYAVGEFMKAAREKPWFDDTLFVFVADHCGSSAGKTSLPLRKYEIPLILYSPKTIEPARISKLCSQIDVAPTLLALLNWDYDSKFLGRNILTMKPDEERAFVGTYQKLGYLKGDRLTVLLPKGGSETYVYDRVTKKQVRTGVRDADLTDAISYYQSASWLYKNGMTRRIKGEPGWGA